MTEIEIKILYRFSPQSVFCEDEKNRVDFVGLHQMMSKFINCRGQLQAFQGIFKKRIKSRRYMLKS